MNATVVVAVGIEIETDLEKAMGFPRSSFRILAGDYELWISREGQWNAVAWL